MKGALFAAAGLVLASASCDAYPPVPAHPAYDHDVRPILMAHCARCHGAGGTLNVPTEPTGPDAAVLPSITEATTPPYVTQFDTTGDCNSNPPTDCKIGAAALSALISSYAHEPADAPMAMPPPPAGRLNEWELGVLANWAKNPICSSSPTPDPAICPNGAGVYTP